MKCKLYTVDSFKGGRFFCPSCHREVVGQFASMNIRAVNGMKINCSKCSCGSIKVMPSAKLREDWAKQDAKKVSLGE